MTALEGRSIMIVTHVLSTGPADALEEYAASRAREVVYVGHRFARVRPGGSFMRVWRQGVLASRAAVRWSALIPAPTTWIKDFAVTVFWGSRSRSQIDVYVGANGLNAAAGLLLRRRGKVRKVVFWTIDYVPDRFPNRLLNWIYHAIDRLCVTRCDETWNLSLRMEEARAARGAPGGRQRVVPMGANVLRPTSEYIGSRIVFVGHLLEKQGVQLAIRALPIVRRRIADAHLIVIGDGPYRHELERLVENLSLGEAVSFTGYVDRHDDVEREVSRSAVGLATYDSAQASFSYYADPGKVKTYLACGVPVVMTDVPAIATEVAEAGAGRLAEYTAESIASAILEVIADAAARERFRSRAFDLGKQWEWTGIFESALSHDLVA